MNFIEQDSRNRIPSASTDETRTANYFAFFDKPSPENLAANRSGILTLQQQKALEDMIADQKNSARIFGAMSVFSILFLCFLFWKIDSSDGAISFTAQMINAAVAILIFGMFMGFVVGDWFFFFAGDDIANGVVESSLGKIEWSGKRYQMRTENRLLRSLRFGRSTLPPPGEYRFYYLPRTGLVVMAEEVGKNDVRPVLTLLQALANTNSFSLEDLKVNQKGLLSKRQENRLLLLIVTYLMIGLGSAALLVIFSPQILRAVSSTSLFVLLIVGSLLLLRFSWSAAEMIADLWHGHVDSVEGPVTRQSHRAKYSISYFYVCGPYRFQVSSSAYHALIEGKPYRIFYAPRSKRLVSIEPIQIERG